MARMLKFYLDKYKKGCHNCELFCKSIRKTMDSQRMRESDQDLI